MITRFALDAHEAFNVQLPFSSEVLGLVMGGDIPLLIVNIAPPADPPQGNVSRTFVPVPIGTEPPEDAQYVGTASIRDGLYIVAYYELNS